MLTYTGIQWSYSSAVEHYVDIVGVTGSIPVVTTIRFENFLRGMEVLGCSYDSFLMFFLVDAFTSRAFKGNPAGVFIVDEYPANEELLKLSSYYNWSEIAFIKPIKDDTFRIRWFSPKDEAPLCGHATLASTYVLFNSGYAKSNKIQLIYNSGTIDGEIDNSGKVSIYFPLKPVEKCSKPKISTYDLFGIRKSVGCERDDLVYVIELEDPEAVRNAKPNFDLIKQVDCRAIAITARGYEFDFHSRYFAPRVGIYEDPVCGSMHCRLANYWSKKLGKNAFRGFQESKRTGIVNLEIIGDLVKLSGDAVITCKFKLP